MAKKTTPGHSGAANKVVLKPQEENVKPAGAGEGKEEIVALCLTAVVLLGFGFGTFGLKSLLEATFDLVFPSIMIDHS